ncbi:MAG: MAG4270 family putative restriction endonuclease, partial [Alphaproteobacteria bacterium]
KIATTYVELYEIAEGGLEALPASAREVIAALGNITIITSDAILERTEFENNDSLRSPAYIYNLLEKLGDKKCALCNCEIPQIIQGAHIWPVASIKKATDMSPEQKLASAIDADNGIWLCNNHHKLFDINWILINKQGQIKVKPGVREVDENYLAAITLINQIGQDILTPQFLEYLERRNNFG